MTEEASSPRRARPRAFRLDATGQVFDDSAGIEGSKRLDIAVERRPDPYVGESGTSMLSPDEAAIENAQQRGMLVRFRLSWGGLFWAALSGLVSIGLGLWVDQLIEDLFARSLTLGWTGVGLAGLAVLSLCALATREIVGVFSAVTGGDLARSPGGRPSGRRSRCSTIESQNAQCPLCHRPLTASARAEIERTSHEIIDGRDLIDIAERLCCIPSTHACRARSRTRPSASPS